MVPVPPTTHRSAPGARNKAVALPNSFRSLRNPNYRRYFTGQVISLSGTWAQNIGLL